MINQGNDLGTPRRCCFQKVNLLTIYTMNWRKNLKGRKIVKSPYLPKSSCIAWVSCFVSCFQNVFSVGGRWSSLWSLNWSLDKALILWCGKVLFWVANIQEKSKSELTEIKGNTWRWFNMEHLISWNRHNYLKYM